MGDITLILGAMNRGDATASDQLLELIHGELRRLAAAKISREPSPKSSTAARQKFGMRISERGMKNKTLLIFRIPVSLP